MFFLFRIQKLNHFTVKLWLSVPKFSCEIIRWNNIQGNYKHTKNVLDLGDLNIGIINIYYSSCMKNGNCMKTQIYFDLSK